MSELIQTYEAYIVPLMIVMVVIILALLYGVKQYKNLVHRQKETLKEKDEKITWLREISAENDHRNLNKIHQFEKDIQALNHTIATLELKVKEGTKNQVVAKIEAQQRKRASQLERAGLETE
jgi:uncharacterized protein HemX